MKRVCEVLGVARSNVADKLARPADWRDGRTARSTDDGGLVEEIRLAVADLPSYGYRRVWGLLRRQRENHGAAPSAPTRWQGRGVEKQSALVL